jgi:IS1 family transposase
MANVLPIEKKTMVISALAEGNSIRSIERMTGIHRDTIMRLGVKVGEGCEKLHNETMRNLTCKELQLDEIWGFIGMKQKTKRVGDDPTKGDVWTWVAIDPRTKLIPSYVVGKRTKVHCDRFISDLASRVANRPQISTDALSSYVKAIDFHFGGQVDYGQIVKTYAEDISAPGSAGKYSPPEVIAIEKIHVMGVPDEEKISTSHVERQNLTMRMHMRRLTRLTNAFSKKLENFKAAASLHFAYYNFVKRHSTIRCTPAMAAGLTNDFWTVEELIKKTT